MRRQTLVFLLFTGLFAGMASGQQNDPGAVSCTQFMAWSAGGMSSQRLLRVAQQRGISFTLDAPASQLLLTAGAEPAVLQNLRKTSLGSTHSAPGKADAGCSAPLAHTAELIQQKRYQEAQSVLRKLIAADPGNAALYFVLGYVHQQQEDWDEALESYQDSEDRMPGLSDVHSRLAYLFYRDDDSDNAIAEARTALSIDPRNAEAYRFLGLGCTATPNIPRQSTRSTSRLPATPITQTCTTTWESPSVTKATLMRPRLLTVKRSH